MDTSSSPFSNESNRVADKIISLSGRQVQVLTLVAEGATDNEIARQLGLSAKTVSMHLKIARTRLDARSRAHAVALALRQDLLPGRLSRGEDP